MTWRELMSPQITWVEDELMTDELLMNECLQYDGDDQVREHHGGHCAREDCRYLLHLIDKLYINGIRHLSDYTYSC